MNDFANRSRLPPTVPLEVAHLCDPLTPRETEVLQLIVSGLSSREIAGQLGITFKTVDSHRCNLMQKLNVHNVATLVRYAIRNKLVES